MAAQRLIRGVQREIWRELVAQTPGDGAIPITTNIRIGAGQLCRVQGVFACDVPTGSPAWTVVPSRNAAGFLVVTVTNTAAGGNNGTWTLDVRLVQSPSQANQGATQGSPGTTGYIVISNGATSGLNAPQTLAATYLIGGAAADQTMTLTDTDGGGILINATDADFTDTSALEIRQNHAHESPLLLSRYLASVNVAGPNLTFYREGGVFGANGNVATDDELGTIDFSGYNAGGAGIFARIVGLAINVGADPDFLLNSAIDFYCSYENIVTRAWRMDKSANGAVLIGYGAGGSPSPTIMPSANGIGTLGLVGTQWHAIHVETANVYDNVCLDGAAPDAAAHNTILLPVAGTGMPAPQVGQVYLGAVTFTGDSGQADAALALVSEELAIAIGQKVATHLIPLNFNGHDYYVLAYDDDQQA
jgi:hypothetical protein